MTPSTLAKPFRGEFVPQGHDDQSAAVLLECVRGGVSRKKNRVTFFPLREFLAAKLSRSRNLGKIRFYAISTRVLAEYLGYAEIRNVVY